MRKICTLLSCFLLLFLSKIVAQQAPFADEISEFRRLDSLHPMKKKPIVFTGSSSIRMWKNLQESFPGYKVVNRGFGGSTLADLDRYIDQIVLPYKPKQVVIYSGENDIASDSVNASEVFNRFQSVYTKIRSAFPSIPIEFVSIKPSPSRLKFLPIVKESNALIRKFISTQKNAHFIDVFTPMLDANGEPRKDIFLEDALHMNPKGYEIWREAILPYLKK